MWLLLLSTYEKVSKCDQAPFPIFRVAPGDKATATWFVLLNRQDFKFESNTRGPQDGGRMYPSRDVCFIIPTLYMKGIV